MSSSSSISGVTLAKNVFSQVEPSALQSSLTSKTIKSSVSGSAVASYNPVNGQVAISQLQVSGDTSGATYSVDMAFQGDFLVVTSLVMVGTSTPTSATALYYPTTGTVSIPLLTVVGDTSGTQYTVTLQQQGSSVNFSVVHAALALGDTPPTFTKGSTQLLAANSIFPGIVHDGTRLVISYARMNQLYIRAYDSSFTPVSSETAVTSSSDAEVGAGVTDHKHIFFQGAHYLAFSTIGDADLFLVKLDKDFKRVGSIVTVSKGSTTTKTNDMLLGTDGVNLLTGEFRPSDLNNREPYGHLIKKYDTNLNYLSQKVVNQPEHINTAAIGLAGSSILLVAPSKFVPGAAIQTQRDLLLMKFDTSLTPLSTVATKLVDSTTITHTKNGEGIWMSTGLAYDATSNLLFVGHTFTSGEVSGSDNGTLYFRVFNYATSAELFSEKMVTTGTANRAHFLLFGDTLYVVYDDNGAGSPSVYGLKYTITRSP